MAEAITNIDYNVAPWQRIEWDRMSEAPIFLRTQTLRAWDEGKFAEIAFSVGAGFAVKNGFRLGATAIGLGTQSWIATVAIGAAAGATVSLIKETRRIQREGGSIDIGRIARGAAFGAVGGLGGGLLREAWDASYFAEHNPLEWTGGAIGETFHRIGEGTSGLFGHPTMPWDEGWHFPGLTPPEAKPAPT